ncbi:MAG: hypothetical protein E6J82_18750 [Deltaproteobacteria bacterium]|nr:MAG: hypothetical protein E6J82_18750 [Deltaproteobacteria bacterium]
MRTRRAARPNATLLCRRIVADMARKLPELSHIQVARILFVAGEARRTSRATIKPLLGARVSLKGPEQRVETLLHELLHVSAEFDGRLHAGRRHAVLPGTRFRSLLRPLLRRYLADADADLLSGLGHHGDVVARQWLERPTGKSSRRQPYTEKDLFFGPVQMITRRHLHS